MLSLCHSLQEEVPQCPRGQHSHSMALWPFLPPWWSLVQEPLSNQSCCWQDAKALHEMARNKTKRRLVLIKEKTFSDRQRWSQHATTHLSYAWNIGMFVGASTAHESILQPLRHTRNIFDIFWNSHGAQRCVVYVMWMACRADGASYGHCASRGAEWHDTCLE